MTQNDKNIGFAISSGNGYYYLPPILSPFPKKYSRSATLYRTVRAVRGTSPRPWLQWGATAALLAICTMTGLIMSSMGMPNAVITGLYMLGVLGVSILTTGPGTA